MMNFRKQIARAGVVAVLGGLTLAGSGCGNSKASRAQSPPPSSLSAPVRVERRAPRAAQAPQATVVPADEYAFLKNRQTGASKPLPRVKLPETASATAKASISTAATAKAPATYIMKKGDTLYAIARKFNVPPKKLIAANRFPNPNKLLPGTKVIVPR